MQFDINARLVKRRERRRGESGESNVSHWRRHDGSRQFRCSAKRSSLRFSSPPQSSLPSLSSLPKGSQSSFHTYVPRWLCCDQSLWLEIPSLVQLVFRFSEFSHSFGVRLDQITLFAEKSFFLFLFESVSIKTMNQVMVSTRLQRVLLCYRQYSRSLILLKHQPSHFHVDASYPAHRVLLWA